MNARGIIFAVLVAVLMMAGCATKSSRAPIVDRLPGSQSSVASQTPVAKSKEPDWRPATYTVQKGDTLYSIALEHGQDYKELAEWNGITAPYIIRIGQTLRLAASQTGATTPLKSIPASEAKPLATLPGLKTEPKATKQIYSEQALAQLEKPAAKSAPVTPPKPEIAKVESPKPAAASEPPKPEASAGEEEDSVDWGWPASGKILANFNDNGNSKGVDIGGTPGQTVTASATGKVVHTGSTLRGYGKLIIIKHNKSYFSVYAHNNQVLVREGQTVVKGQKIAEMGNSDADRVKLHFEIRRLGKPVDPLKYLPSDKPS